MAIDTRAEPARQRDTLAIVLVGGSVILTLATAYIHSTLGTLLFTMNAIGYTVLAIALVVPLGPLGRFRWLVRLGLLAFVLATIGGWILFGARYDVAYFDKAIEVVLVGFLVASIYRFDGGPTGVLARLRALPADLSELLRSRLGRLAALVGVALAVAACGSNASPSALPVPSGALVIHVQNTKFQPADPSVTSGQGITLYFDNEDSLPHDLVLLAADGSRAFATDVVTGPAQRTYQVPALASGTYKLQCDIHHEMTGSLTVP